ncbi:MAG: glycosyltransferase family protein [Melioribacteraceae bacterium]
MIVAIIQARTGSTRLPNKVLKNLCGKPLIWHIINRLKYSKKIEKIVLATTQNENDDTLEKWARENGIDCFRGNENDVLDRYYKAAQYFSAGTIVRITADDPFKDPYIIDEVLELYEKNNLDFAYNNKPPTFPEGLDTEVFSFDALEIAFKNSVDPFEREHVTQFFYRNPSIFKQLCLFNETNLSYLRWTIDTQLDWDMVEIIYNRLYKLNEIFSMFEILDLLKKEPDIARINSTVERSTFYKKTNKEQI